MTSIVIDAASQTKNSSASHTELSGRTASRWFAFPFHFLKIFLFACVWAFACIYVCALGMCSAHKGQQRAMDLLLWVLGIELMFFERAAGTHNKCSISLALPSVLEKETQTGHGVLCSGIHIMWFAMKSVLNSQILVREKKQIADCYWAYEPMQIKYLNI